MQRIAARNARSTLGRGSGTSPAKPAGMLKSSSTFYGLLLWSSVAACAAAADSQRAAAYPGSSGPLCDYVGLEAAEGPAHDNLDSVALVAEYRLSEPNSPPPAHPIGLTFRVARSRVNELRGQLEAHPQVICRPDASARYRVEPANFGEFVPVQGVTRR